MVTIVRPPLWNPERLCVKPIYFRHGIAMWVSLNWRCDYDSKNDAIKNKIRGRDFPPPEDVDRETENVGWYPSVILK